MKVSSSAFSAFSPPRRAVVIFGTCVAGDEAVKSPHDRGLNFAEVLKFNEVCMERRDGAGRHLEVVDSARSSAIVRIHLSLCPVGMLQRLGGAFFLEKRKRKIQKNLDVF